MVRCATARLLLSPFLLIGNIVPGVYTPLLAKDSETEGPEVGLQEFRQIGTRKRASIQDFVSSLADLSGVIPPHAGFWPTCSWPSFEDRGSDDHFAMLSRH